MANKAFASSLGDYIYINVVESAWKKLLWWIRYSLIPDDTSREDDTHLF
jgi:hypothetical protein